MLLVFIYIQAGACSDFGFIVKGLVNVIVNYIANMAGKNLKKRSITLLGCGLWYQH